MTVFLKAEKSKVSGNRKMKQANCQLELLTPGLKSVEALMVLEHRVNRDFKEREKYRGWLDRYKIHVAQKNSFKREMK